MTSKTGNKFGAYSPCVIDTSLRLKMILVMGAQIYQMFIMTHQITK